jgi:hypothetical protein
MALKGEMPNVEERDGHEDGNSEVGHAVAREKSCYVEQAELSESDFLQYEA